MDPKLIAKHPFVKKIIAILIALTIVELALFVLVCYFFGFGPAILITLGFTILGYSIKPYKNPFAQDASQKSLNPLANFTETRKFVGTLFMIPGFLTDIIGILLLLPPVRKGVVSLGKKIAEKKLKKLGLGGIDPSLFANLGNFAGMGGSNPFGGGFNSNMYANRDNSSSNDNKSDPDVFKTHSEKRRAKRERRKQAQTVDVDYEIRDGDGIWIGGRAESPTDVVVKMKHDHAPKALDADVIDVESEWK